MLIYFFPFISVFGEVFHLTYIPETLFMTVNCDIIKVELFLENNVNALDL